MGGRPARQGRLGYTLIEVLVVVAIIALLISILLPVLARAREEARRIACAASLSQLCKAEFAYATTQQDWIPGSPLTTGYYFAANAFAPWPAGDSGPRHNRFAATWDDYATSLRVEMYKTSSIPAPTPANGEEVRWRLIRDAMEGVFHCPSNPQVAFAWGAQYQNETWKSVRAPSYMTMWTLMRGGTDVYDQQKVLYPGARARSDIGQSPRWELVVPRGYVPKHSKLGQESLKVFLADGLRYYDETTAVLTYNPQTNGTKGIWMATPPSTAGTIGREYNLARTLSYRHGDLDLINAGFFDGHVESLRVAGHRGADVYSGYKGPAIHPKYYHPSGTVVKDASTLHQPIPVGTVLP